MSMEPCGTFCTWSKRGGSPGTSTTLASMVAPTFSNRVREIDRLHSIDQERIRVDLRLDRADSHAPYAVLILAHRDATADRLR